MNPNTYPLISVCIPAYNHERYIRKCLEAVLTQDYPNIELIVIDDGSKDSTWSVLQELRPACEKRCRRVVMLHQENQGTCITLNRLFSLAQGEYIAITASDDAFLPHAFINLSNFLSSHPQTGLVVGKNLIMDENSVRCYWDAQRNNVYDKNQAVYRSFTESLTEHTNRTQFGTYSELLKANHITNGWMFRKNLLSQIPPFTPKAPMEDWWFMLQISKVARISEIPEETFSYRWHAANTIKQAKKMHQLSLKTLQYEWKCVSKQKKSRWAKEFREICCKKISIFKIFNLLHFYKLNTPRRKLKILEIAGYKIRILSKKP